jgi:hypothetical protein
VPKHAADTIASIRRSLATVLMLHTSAEIFVGQVTPDREASACRRRTSPN